MARTIREAKLGTPTSRRRLKAGRQPHWHTIVAARDHLGYQRRIEDKVGRWLLRRRRAGHYSMEPIGTADDARQADGISVLSFDQARAKAVELASTETRPAGRITVAKAVADYVDFLRSQGRNTYHAESTAAVHILPRLGDQEVGQLTSAQLRRWLIGVADQPARKRSKAAGRQKFKALDSDESIRRRRSSANRILATFKAILNHAYDERRCPSNDAWGRRLKRFKGVDGVRTRFLSTAEAVRLINACDPDFRLLVRAALETGMRYGELCRLEVADFSPSGGTVAVRRSKTGRARYVVLTAEGAAFFMQACAGRIGAARLFLRDDGEPWARSNQGRHMAEANRRAKVEPPITFHGLRHTWASLAVMNGTPLMVVARNLGHADTKQVERHYGHLSESYVFEAIRSGAPRYAVDSAGNIEVIGKRVKEGLAKG
jgi:integrase